MLKLPDGLLGRELDIGIVEVAPEELRAYAAAVGEPLAGPPPDGDRLAAPLGFLLSLRGELQPAVELESGAVGVHAGHVITLHRPLTAPGRYAIRKRLTEVFEKSGRSGPLTVLVRRAEIATADGVPVATVEDQQIVRWRGAASAANAESAAIAESAAPLSAELAPQPSAAADRPRDRPSAAADREIGGMAVEQRIAPDPPAIAAYAARLAGGESLFTDVRYARSLGFANVIVPGPLQSAIIETFLRRVYPDLQLRRLALTFRVSLPASEPITMTSVVIEHPTTDAIVCDLSIENGDGDRAAIGTAQLGR